jgi:type I restriction enzyme S subunit
MSEWEKYRLDEIASHLGDGLHGTPMYDEKGEYYFINGSNLIDGKVVINSNTRRVNETEYHKYKKNLSDKSILLGINGTIGNVALYNGEKCILGKSSCYINVDEKFDKQFIKYVLLNDDFQNYIKTNATGTTIKNVGLKLLREYEAFVPSSIDEQKRIASGLLSFDDKIALNMQMNQTLEEMAQHLFKEWFVNFNFPGFDGELIDGLPSGWRKCSILEIAKLLSGGTPKTDIDEYWNGDIKWISAKDITANNRRFIIETEKRITKTGVENSAAKLLPIYTTIISARGTVGNFSILPEQMTISQSNYGLKAKGKWDFFLFILVETMIDMMQAFSYGTVFDTITTKTFHEMEVIIPPEDLILQYENQISPLFTKVLENQKQNQTLTQLRDSLLPKLMTGKIQIKE